MPLKGCGYRWIARRRMISRQKREHREKAKQDLYELRQKIFGEAVSPELRKGAMAEVRTQAKNQMMGFREFKQQPQGSFFPQNSFSHEVIHNLGPSDLRPISNLKLMKDSKTSAS